MAKLFPPVIEGIVPAFYDNDEGKIVIVLPFAMNRAVSQSQVKGLAIKIKTVQSSNYIYTGKTTDILNFDLEDSCWVRFIINKNEVSQMKPGLSYKFQLAYIDKTDTVGYYSTVGVGKYTKKPDVYIEGLTIGQVNSHQYQYNGFYSQKNKDTTETVYSYIFNVYNSDNEIIATSGEQLHNSSTDTEIYESYDEFFFPKELEIDKNYYIQYTVNTINNLTISSPKYRIMQKLSIDPEINATLEAVSNQDNGYITIKLVGQKNDLGLEEPVTGAFLLTRSSEDDNYTEWDEISRFKLAAQLPSRTLWTDYTIEQGKNYKYSLQQYNDNGLYSNRIYSNVIYSDFEDAFLFDGTKQLKIKYNPKIASFKKDVLETKIDTIGSKYPFILRNGRVNYKEFSISGLISYFMDEESTFLTPNEYNFKEKTTNLTGDNIAQEREFKLKVYEWLTNGESKLFRSPNEGNYIVRLMNVSLSPNDTLGRMLHTFTATAYEVAEYNYSNLSSFGFIHLEDPEVVQLCFASVNLGETYITTDDYGNRVVNYKYAYPAIINKYPVHSVKFTDMNPGDKVILSFYDRDDEIIQIGVTGSYNVDLGVAIKSITFAQNVIPTGSAVCSYYSIQSNVFDKIDNVYINEVPVQQFIGEHDIIKEIEYIKDLDGNWVKNPKVDLLKFYNISVQKRSIEKITSRTNKNFEKEYFKDKDQQVPLEDNPDLFTLYACGTWSTIQDSMDDPSYLPYDKYNWQFQIKNYVDFANGKQYEANQYQPIVMINGSQVSVEDSRDFFMDTPGKLDSLICGNGCIIEASYQIRTIAYLIEDNPDYEVVLNKENYLKAKKELDNYLKEDKEIVDNGVEVSNNSISLDDFSKKVEELRNTVKRYYRLYILSLIKAQKEEKEAEGLI